jgi:hypothetical protein
MDTDTERRSRRFNVGGVIVLNDPRAKVEEEMLKKVVPHSVATALASMVLPVL